jgi:molecular chaperone GrpE
MMAKKRATSRSHGGSGAEKESKSATAAAGEPKQVPKAEAPSTEATQDEAAEETAHAEEPSLEKQLADARQALEETERKYLYSVAELQNYKRRMQRELADRMQFANEELLRDLLPLLDNFRLAVRANSQDPDAEAVLDGVRLMLQQFEDLLSSYGVQPVNAEPGTDFDPSVHEAVERLDAGPEMRGKIVEELAQGYTFRDRLLRPAKVKAGALAAEAEDEEKS